MRTGEALTLHPVTSCNSFSTLKVMHCTIAGVHEPFSTACHVCTVQRFSIIRYTAACPSDVHINHSASIWQPRTRSRRRTGPETERRSAAAPGSRASLCLSPPPPRLGARLTGQMLLLDAGHSWLDPSCYASILLRDSYSTRHAPTHKQTRKRANNSRPAARARVHVHALPSSCGVL